MIHGRYHMMSRRIINRIFFTICAALLLGACAQIPPHTTNAWEQQAQNQLQEGHPKTAANIYLEAASSLPSPERQRVMLKAASVLLQARLPKRTRAVIESIDPTGLTANERANMGLLTARADLFEHKPSAALAALPHDIASLTPQVLANLLEVRAQAEQLNDNAFAAIRDRIALGHLLPASNTRYTNTHALWEILSQATPTQIQDWQQQATDRHLKAWLSLALLSKNTPPSLTALNKALTQWQQQYPGIADALPIIKALRRQWQSMRVYPNHIAILLPLSGHFAPVAHAILDGILSAYYVNESQSKRASNISLHVYDTTQTHGHIMALYNRAVSDGAQFVIGPLDRDAVTQLAQDHLPVPTLALNYASNGTATPTGLYQFGLLPENEAKQVAERASLDGHSHAIVLVPDDTWGQRIASAFTSKFNELDGQVLAVGYYDPSASDFTPAIVNTFNIDYSKARRREVSATIGQPVGFEARRRQDIDMIFIAGDPRQVRLLMPQIRFHHGIGLPVYSISTAYSGTHDPQADHDLDGLTFIDAPVLLDTQGAAASARVAMHASFPNASRRYPRLIALGEDAFNVLPYLKRLASEDWARFNGLSGILKMGPGHALIRQLEGAQFHGGIPTLLGQAMPVPATHGSSH